MISKDRSNNENYRKRRKHEKMRKTTEAKASIRPNEPFEVARKEQSKPM